MKAILEFNLPDDKFDFALATNAYKYYAALSSLADKLRSIDKYGTDEQRAMDVSQVRELFYETMNEEDASLDVGG